MRKKSEPKTKIFLEFENLKIVIFDVANILILYKFFFDKFFWELKKNKT